MFGVVLSFVDNRTGLMDANDLGFAFQTALC